MIIIPAIDLLDGKVVRLFQGDYNKVKVYYDSPLEAAQRWEEEGAKIIHVVDLNGTKEGKFKNLDIVKKIADKIKTKIHFGGGIRSLQDIKTILDLGVERVVIGTKVFTDQKFLKEISKDSELKKQLDRIIVSVDSKILDKKDYPTYAVSHTGWTGTAVESNATESNVVLTPFTAIRIIEKWGIKMVMVTDIMRDGTLFGPNIELLKNILDSTKIQIIASGGVSSLEDIKTLKKLKSTYNNLYAVIIGKAFYEHKINLGEAIQYAKENTER